MYVNTLHFRRQKFDQERSQKHFKLYRPYNNNTFYVKCKIKNYASKIRAIGTISKSFKKYLNNV